VQRFLGEIKSLNSGPDTCAGLVTKPVCPGINVRYTSVVKLHVSTTVCPQFYFFGHSVSMSLKNNSPKVHSNYWRAVMQGQRPFRFALIIVTDYKPVSKCELPWPRYHKTISPRKFEHILCNNIFEKKIYLGNYIYKGWDRINLVISPA
jgi:hypothetical protein